MPKLRQTKKRGNIVVVKDPLYVPPSFKPPDCSYPPYCSRRRMVLNIKTWRVATVTVGVEPATDPEKDLIERWVTQLVRGQLGEALGEAERKLKRTLAISLELNAVTMISEALRIRAP